MDFTKIGTLSSYTKSMKLENDWRKKKRTGDFQSQSKKSELQRKNDQFKADFKKQQQEQEKDKMLQTINAKIAAGADLTPSEMKYLQTKNPTQYQELKNQEIDKKSYERELKSCKTKEDVDKLKMKVVSSALSSIGAVKSNPNIPDSAKLAVAQKELKKLDEYNKINKKFVDSGEYSKLPTEADERKVEKDKAEAREAEIEKIQEAAKKLVEDMEKEIKPETTENTKINDEPEKVENNNDDNTEYEVETETKAVVNNENNNTKIDIEEDRPTEIEAEYSDEAKKVKRARVKAAYAESKNTAKAASGIMYIINKTKV